METTRTWYIYILLDPRNNAVRYVGWSFAPRKRLAAHIRRAKYVVSHKAHWIMQLTSAGLRPNMEIVETGYGDWNEAERRWIAHYRSAGCNLTNLTDGGEGTVGYNPTPEERHRRSLSQTGRKQTAESTAKTRAALLGRKQSEQHRQRLAVVRKGKIPWAATQAAAIRSRGRCQTPEHIEKRIAPRRGRPVPKLRKLTNEQVAEIRCSELSLRKLAVKYGVGQTTIFEIRHRFAYQDT